MGRWCLQDRTPALSAKGARGRIRIAAIGRRGWGGPASLPRGPDAACGFGLGAIAALVGRRTKSAGIDPPRGGRGAASVRLQRRRNAFLRQPLLPFGPNHPPQGVGKSEALQAGMSKPDGAVRPDLDSQSGPGQAQTNRPHPNIFLEGHEWLICEHGNFTYAQYVSQSKAKADGSIRPGGSQVCGMQKRRGFRSYWPRTGSVAGPFSQPNRTNLCRSHVLLDRESGVHRPWVAGRTHAQCFHARAGNPRTQRSPRPFISWAAAFVPQRLAPNPGTRRSRSGIWAAAEWGVPRARNGAARASKVDACRRSCAERGPAPEKQGINAHRPPVKGFRAGSLCLEGAASRCA